MENLFLTVKEHKGLEKWKDRLEKVHGVKILMPNVDKAYVQTGIIFATICGTTKAIRKVKNFISKKLSASAMAAKNKNSKSNKIAVITLSDSEEEADSIFETSAYEVHPNSKKEELDNVESLSLCTKASVYTENTCSSTSSNLNNSIIVEDYRKPKKVKKKSVSSSVEDSEICEVTSTTCESIPKKRRYMEEPKERDKSEPLPSFIPLCKKTKSQKDSSKENKLPNVLAKSSTEQDIVVNDTQNPLQTPRRLRLIVIDGSNVARAHGKPTNSYSIKGVELAIQYFLKRGHTDVFAIIPLFRRYRTIGLVPTTRLDILEKLYSDNHIVFTPSRNVEGNRITCYDDRFIVRLSSEKNGIIVSNDNFKDIVSESESFKKAIEERLLMFCFAGDVFMVPEDPLGRNGPSLEEYLSFSQEEIIIS